METFEETQRRYKLSLIDAENDRNQRLEDAASRADNAGRSYLANYIREHKSNIKEAIEYKPPKFSVNKIDAVVNTNYTIPEKIKGIGKYDKSGKFVTYNHTHQKIIDDFFDKNKRYPDTNELSNLFSYIPEVKTTKPNVEEGKYSLLPFDEGLRAHEDSALLDAELLRLKALEDANKIAEERRKADKVETPEETLKRTADELSSIKKLDEVKFMIDRIKELRKHAPVLEFESELNSDEAPPPNPNYTYTSDKIGRLRNIYYRKTGVSPGNAVLEEELKLGNTSGKTTDEMENEYYTKYGSNPTQSNLEEEYWRINPPNYESEWKPLFEEDFKKRKGRDGTEDEIKKEYLIFGSGLKMKDLENHLRQRNEKVMKDDFNTKLKSKTRFPLVSIGRGSNKEAINIDRNTMEMIKDGEKRLGF